MTATARGMLPADIDALVAAERPSVAPDGSFGVFAARRPSLRGDRYVGRLHRVDLATRTVRALTRGIDDRAPRVSPDGALVAFLRGDDRGRPQVWVVEAAGGEPMMLTDRPLGVREYAWSPDSRTLAVTAPVPEAGRYGQIEGLDAAAEPPRLVTGVRWHANGAGYVLDRPVQLFLVDVPALDAEPAIAPAPGLPGGAGVPGEDDPERAPGAAWAAARQLTAGDRSVGSPAFTADGTGVLVVTDEIERDRRDLRSALVRVPVQGGDEVAVLGAGAGLSIDEVAVAPDGAIYLLASAAGESGIDFVAPGVALWRVDASGPVPLTDPETDDLGEVGSHLGFGGEDVLVQRRARGRVELLRIAPDGAVRVLRGDADVMGHGASADGTRILAAIATETRSGEIELWAAGEWTRVTDLAPELAERVVVPRELEITGRDAYPVHGWVATPEGEGPFPVILQIHGGPYAQYGIHLFDETQVLVRAGYAVVYANPRGSAGYGRAHGRSIRQRMGTLDFDDVTDFLDGAIAADPRLDGARVGIMGGSYGGYLTAWAIAHEHRFAGAIVERGFLDPASFAGTSDIGSFFGDEYVGTDPAVIAAQSPMAVVDRVRTPTLVMHSELDYRCPLEQATRYYSALKRQGVETEMLIFPGEDHDLTRAGRPRHRAQRFEAVLSWWRRHLPID